MSRCCLEYAQKIEKEEKDSQDNSLDPGRARSTPNPSTFTTSFLVYPVSHGCHCLVLMSINLSPVEDAHSACTPTHSP